MHKARYVLERRCRVVRSSRSGGIAGFTERSRWTAQILLVWASGRPVAGETMTHVDAQRRPATAMRRRI